MATVAQSLPVWASSQHGEVARNEPDHSLEEGLALLDVLCAPASDEELAVAVERLLRFATTFGLPALDNRDDVIDFYNEALAGLPVDMLVETIDSVIAAWRWSDRMPLPADVRGHIPDAWAQRRAVQRKGERAKAERRRIIALREKIDKKYGRK